MPVTPGIVVVAVTAGVAAGAAAGVADGAVAVQPQASTARMTRRMVSAIFMDRELWHMPDKSDWSGGGGTEYEPGVLISSGYNLTKKGRS